MLLSLNCKRYSLSNTRCFSNERRTRVRQLLLSKILFSFANPLHNKIMRRATNKILMRSFILINYVFERTNIKLRRSAIGFINKCKNNIRSIITTYDFVVQQFCGNLISHMHIINWFACSLSCTSIIRLTYFSQCDQSDIAYLPALTAREAEKGIM